MDKTPLSGAVLERTFCGNCGSPLFIKREGDEKGMVVTRGTLDIGPEAGWTPDVEFFCKRKEVWLESSGANEGKRYKEML